MSLRDLVLYLGIALALVIGGTLYIFLVPPQRWIHLSYSWSVFVFFTVLLGAALAKMYWGERRRTKIWILLVSFLAAHIAVYVVLLQNVQDWSAFWYVLTGPAEVMAFVAIAKAWLDVMPTTTKL
jgi:hypothetical protein